MYALHAQHFSAGPSECATPSGPNDNDATRLQWMHSCLLTASQQLQSELANPWLALPWQLGCVHGGGAWSSYLALLMRVAASQPAVTFLAVRRSNLRRPLSIQVLLPFPPAPMTTSGKEQVATVLMTHGGEPTTAELEATARSAPIVWPRVVRCTVLRCGQVAGCTSADLTSRASHVLQALLAQHGVYVRQSDCLRLGCHLGVSAQGETLVAEYTCNLSSVLFQHAIARGLDLGSRDSFTFPRLAERHPRMPHLVLSACCRLHLRAALQLRRAKASAGFTLQARQVTAAPKIELPCRVFQCTELEELSTLLASYPPETIVLVAFEFSGALAIPLRAAGWLVVTCDFREPESPGCAYRGDVRHVVSLTKWARIFFVGPNCFQHLIGDVDCLPLKIKDGRAFWAGATLLWCICCPHSDHVFVEQPNVLAHRHIDTDQLAGVRVVCFRTSDYSPAEGEPRDNDKFMRITLRNLSFQLPRSLRSQFDFRNPDERDRVRSSMLQFTQLCKHASQATPQLPPAPCPIFDAAVRRYARRYSLIGPVPYDFLNADAQPSSASDRAYQWTRGKGDFRTPVVADPRAYLEPVHEVAVAILDDLIDAACQPTRSHVLLARGRHVDPLSFVTDLGARETALAEGSVGSNDSSEMEEFGIVEAGVAADNDWRAFNTEGVGGWSSEDSEPPDELRHVPRSCRAASTGCGDELAATTIQAAARRLTSRRRLASLMVERVVHGVEPPSLPSLRRLARGSRWVRLLIQSGCREHPVTQTRLRVAAAVKSIQQRARAFIARQQRRHRRATACIRIQARARTVVARYAALRARSLSLPLTSAACGLSPDSVGLRGVRNAATEASRSKTPDAKGREVQFATTRLGVLDPTIEPASHVIYTSDCTSVCGTGLASAIHALHPQLSPHRKRVATQSGLSATPGSRSTPGTVHSFLAPHGRRFTCLFSQWSHDTAPRGRVQAAGTPGDTAAERVRWFEQCLHNLCLQLYADKQERTILMPHRMGCDDRARSWKPYLAAIRAFAQHVPHITVCVVRREGDVAREAASEVALRWSQVDALTTTALQHIGSTSRTRDPTDALTTALLRTTARDIASTCKRDYTKAPALSALAHAKAKDAASALSVACGKATEARKSALQKREGGAIREAARLQRHAEQLQREHLKLLSDATIATKREAVYDVLSEVVVDIGKTPRSINQTEGPVPPVHIGGVWCEVASSWLRNSHRLRCAQLEAQLGKRTTFTQSELQEFDVEVSLQTIVVVQEERSPYSTRYFKPVPRDVQHIRTSEEDGVESVETSSNSRYAAGLVHLRDRKKGKIEHYWDADLQEWRSLATANVEKQRLRDQGLRNVEQGHRDLHALRASIEFVETNATREQEAAQQTLRTEQLHYASRVQSAVRAGPPPGSLVYARGDGTAHWRSSIDVFNERVERSPLRVTAMPAPARQHHAHSMEPREENLVLNDAGRSASAVVSRSARPIHVYPSFGHIPLMLHGVLFEGTDVAVRMGCSDTGSATMLAYEREMRDWLRLYPDSVSRETPEHGAAITEIAGVGHHVTRVLYHVTVRLNFGGQPVVLHSVPVLPGSGGILLGNDLHEAVGASIQFKPFTQSRVEFDGMMLLHEGGDVDKDVVATVPFTTRRSKYKRVEPGAPNCFVAQPCRGEAQPVPLLLAGRPQTLPASKSGFIDALVPAAGLKPGSSVDIGARADRRFKALAVEIHDQLVKLPAAPDNRGFYPVRVFYENHGKKKVTLNCDQPVGRFSLVDEDADIRSLSVPVRSRSAHVDECPSLTALTDSGNNSLVALEQVRPTCISPVSVSVPAYGRATVQVRAPAVAKPGYRLGFVPFPDPKLRVNAIPNTVVLDESGMMDIELVNVSDREASVGTLARLGEFIVDPRVSGLDIEYSIDEVLEKVNLPEHPTEEGMRHIRLMISKTRRFYSSKLGYAHGYKMTIEDPLVQAGTVSPPFTPPRRRSPEEQAALKQIIEKQLREDLIEPTRSPYGALPVLVPKPDGSWRLCLDFRALNAVVTKDTYPLPNIEANLDALGRGDLFTTLDLLQGFFQVEISESSRVKTAFNTPFGQFAYKRMPMGLTSSPSTFMRIVDAALQHLPSGMAVAFVDDVICPTEGNMEQHMLDVTQVFRALVTAGFTARCDKIHLGKLEVPYLGFLVNRAGTRPNPEKTRAILEMTLANMEYDPAAAGRFAGMVGFYSKFLPNLRHSLTLFDALKQKNVDKATARSVMGSFSFMTAFAVIKDQLVNVTALARPNFEVPFYISIDTAVSGGIGGALTQLEDQEDPDSHLPIAWRSRKLSSPERSYPVRDLECLGLVDAVDTWHAYVHGSCTITIVRTDHRSLCWLMTSNHQQGSRVLNWCMKLQRYNISIVYVPGRDLVVPDCISRSFGQHEKEKEKRSEKRGGESAGTTDTAAAVISRYTHFQRKRAATSRLAKALRINSQPPHDIRTRASASRTRHLPSPALAARVADSVELVPKEATPNTVVAGIFLQHAAKGLSILVEQQGGALTLPVVQASVEASYRSQLDARMYNTYSAECGLELRAALKHAISYKRRVPWFGCYTHFFACFTPPLEEKVKLDEYAGTTLRAAFVDFDAELPFAFADKDTFQFLQRLYQEYAGRPVRGHRWVDPQFKHLLGPVSKSLVRCKKAKVGDLSTSTSVVPTLDTAPHGPAFATCRRDSEKACRLLWERTRTADDWIAIDLEGELGGRHPHISLLQAHVEADEQLGLPALTFVLDPHTDPQILWARGAGTLADILSGPARKVLHCCSGDANSLFVGFGVVLQNVIDTGTADLVLTQQKQHRNLGVVIIEHVGNGKNETSLGMPLLNQKGKLKFIPGLFEPRPLPYHLFQYAYEDVEHCVRLGRHLWSLAQSRGLLEITLAYSMQRCPPRSLHPSHPLAQQPSKVCVALVDTDSVVCLHRDGSSHPPRELPCATIRGDPSIAKDVRKEAQEMWVSVMGAPPRVLGQAVNTSLRRAARIDDTWLYLAVTTECSRVLAPLAEAANRKDSGVVELGVHPRVDYAAPSARAVPDQAALFQYLHLDAERKVRRLPQANVVLGSSNPTNERAALILMGRRAASSSSGSAAEPEHEPYVVALLGKEPGKDHATAPLTFPDHPREGETSTAEHCALKAIDLHVGPSLRKGSDPHHLAENHRSALANGRRQVTPYLSTQMARAVEAGLNPVGKFGNTTYFLVILPDLFDLRSGLYASRRELNGFRQVDSVARRHRYPGLCVVSSAELLGTHGLSTKKGADAERLAFAAAREMYQCHPRAQLSYLPLPKVSAEPPPTVRVSHHSEQLPDTAPPVLGSDPDFDAVHLATVVLGMADVYASRSPQGHCQAHVVSRVAGVSTVSDSSFVGDINHPLPTRGDLLAAQLEHPGTRNIWMVLKLGGLLGPSGGSSQFNEFGLAFDGLLVHLGSPTRLVIPPVYKAAVHIAFHDKVAHPGVTRTYDLIVMRFYWGSPTEMRADVRRYVKLCEPCTANKLPQHGAGEYHVIGTGAHPYDVILSDHYKTGFTCSISATGLRWQRLTSPPDDGVEMHHRDLSRALLTKATFTEAEWNTFNVTVHLDSFIRSGRFYFRPAGVGYDGLYTFMCALSQSPNPSPVIGSPTAQEIAWLYITTVMQYYGVSRYWLVDRASVTAGLALTVLSKQYGIHILPSAPYHHRTIGRLERWHATVGDVLATHRFAAKDDEFSASLPALKLVFDAATSSSTGFSPFFVRAGYHPRLPSDTLGDFSSDLPKDLEDWVSRNLQRLGVTLDAANLVLQKNAVKRKIETDRKRDVTTHFKVGDRVRLVDGRILDGATRKGVERTVGPYWVLKVLPKDNYILTNRERNFRKTPIHLSQLLGAPAETLEDSAEFEGSRSVRHVLNRRVRKLRSTDDDLGLAAGESVVEYFVQWCGLGKFANSWVEEARLREFASDLLEEYLAAQVKSEDPEVTSVPTDSQPAVKPSAKRRPHFRRTAESASVPSALEQPEQQESRLEEVLEADVIKEAALEVLREFPVDAQVEVLHGQFEGTKWWPAVVVESRLAEATPTFPILRVIYDDPRYPRRYVVRPWKVSVRQPLQLVKDD